MNAPGLHTRSELSRVQLAAALLWPSFLIAGVITTVVFTLVDPETLPGSLSRTSTYSFGFFFFWAAVAIACACTWYYLKPVSPRVLEPDRTDLEGVR